MREFKTSNLSLAPFLQMSGLKYLRTEPSLGKNDMPVVAFVFEDKRGIGKDLELDFVRSEFKTYKDLTFFYRNEIEKMRRKLDRMSLEEKRKTDDKFYSGD